ncbi:MAG: substrate-binding domain-containing protein [Thiolinea sp.]
MNYLLTKPFAAINLYKYQRLWRKCDQECRPDDLIFTGGITMKKTTIAALLTTLALGAASTTALAGSHGGMSACLITKTDTNPFFVKMKEGATAKAEELGIELKSYAGKVDGDSESQIAAIETCIADGAKGILLTASDTKGIVPAVKQARDAGLLVIALDTPLEPD